MSDTIKKVWVEPTNGAEFGFPKLWDPNINPDLWEWLEQEGYPISEKDKMESNFTINQWSEDQTPSNLGQENESDD